ncbi:MAG: DUF4932 domain-containing protein [Planctomycetes bacterium]|nr:DUF4932 domain-containing protein [Planctomycetota bacterium]MBL7143080.1 DUF4932 domain-containing protein [Phycisphaerae bacterium]
MNKYTTNNKIERTQVAVKNVAFCTVILLVFSIGLSSSALAVNNQPVMYRANVGRIAIEVDPRVELIGIVFRLAGNPEYNDGTLKPYAKAIERHFGDFDGHPVVKMAVQLRNTRLMSADGPMSLAVHIDRNYRLRKTDEEWPSTLDYRWEKEETAEFLEKLRQFAIETKFDEFFKAQSSIYEQGIRPCKSILEQNEVAKDQSGLEFVKFLSADLGEWLSSFYGVKDPGDLRLVLGFVNGFANYGARFAADQISEKYAIVGMRPFDPTNTVIFLPQQIVLVAHEFCHSFTNPVVDKYMDQLQPAGERLFAVQEPAMRNRGYQKWESVMYETAVRACVASFIRDSIADLRFFDYYLKSEVGHGFVWTEDMGNFLKTYENQRDKYPTFESFFPEFVKFLNNYSIKAKL